MLYIVLIVFAILTMCLGLFARKKIAECETETEKKSVKAKWQLICGLIGLACIIVAGIIIFTMFN